MLEDFLELQVSNMLLMMFVYDKNSVNFDLVSSANPQNTLFYAHVNIFLRRVKVAVCAVSLTVASFM